MLGFNLKNRGKRDTKAQFIMQGLFKLGQSREEKFKRVALKIDEEDVIFALQVEMPNLSLLYVLLSAFSILLLFYFICFSGC